MLQLSQSCEQEDFNSSNEFPHLIEPITEQRSYPLSIKVTVFLQYLGFLWRAQGFYLAAAERLWCFFIMIFSHCFTYLLFFYNSICPTLSFQTNWSKFSNQLVHWSFVRTDLKSRNAFCKKISFK